MKTPALMILGTASHVGKSLITTGLCRIFSNDGVRVAPFKAQNMSLNSAATPDGREIGRAQALQAEACRVLPCAEMNPILIKPASDTAAQVIVLGRVWGQMTASNYHRRSIEELFPTVIESYRALAAHYDLIVLEGAGSPAEVNLREQDIVNMRMAHAADASCVLVGDIDRGGVFASLLGTMELLTDRDKARICGFIINKFRGDTNLLRPGIESMEQRLGIPCVGIVPYMRNVHLDEEDGVSLENRSTPKLAWKADDREAGRLRIGVVAFPYIANFTDFDPFLLEPAVSLAFVDEPDAVASADVLILPGSKQTLHDLAWLKSRKLANCVVGFPGPVIGICGGFQMLGFSIEDPWGVESEGARCSASGLGILQVHTVMSKDKLVRRVRGFAPVVAHAAFRGYEIHMGETAYERAVVPFAEIKREGDAQQRTDGAVHASGRIWGSYVHGIFEDDEFRHEFMGWARNWCGISPGSARAYVSADRQARIDRWAEHIQESLDMDTIRGWITRRQP